ncbi:NAD-dependent epimerase/dehydratase family protein [Chloroflexota bacterium]
MSKILVTGGKGAIGASLVRELRRRGLEVWLCDLAHSEENKYIRCDISKYRQVEQMFKSARFDYVYHLAAEFGRWNGEDYYETMWATNAIGTKNILRLQEREQFKMIFTSSSEIYGGYEDVMYEDVPMKFPLRQLNDYAISKWANEQQILNSADRFGTETLRVRLFNTYGPGEYYSEYRSVICQLAYKALYDIPYTVYLNHHRTSSYVDDTVSAMANTIDNFKPGEVYNICGDEYHSIKKLSDIVLELVGKDDSQVKYVDVEKHNVLNKKGNNEKAKRDLKYQPKVDLRDGIGRTIEWQKEIYQNG